MHGMRIVTMFGSGLVFGLGLVVWFTWLGVVLLRDGS